MESTRRHPVRGAVFGFVIGIGLALIGIGQGIVALGTIGPALLVLLGVVLGVVWGLFAPARGSRSAPVD